MSNVKKVEIKGIGQIERAVALDVEAGDDAGWQQLLPSERAHTE